MNAGFQKTTTLSENPDLSLLRAGIKQNELMFLKGSLSNYHNYPQDPDDNLQFNYLLNKIVS